MADSVIEAVDLAVGVAGDVLQHRAPGRALDVDAEVAGLGLFIATWLVLQALKKGTPWLRKYLPWVVVLLAALYVGTYRWVPEVFLILAGTMLTAAGILGGDAMIKRLTEKRPPAA